MGTAALAQAGHVWEAQVISKVLLGWGWQFQVAIHHVGIWVAQLPLGQALSGSM
jgi:hypothetical protein